MLQFAQIPFLSLIRGEPVDPVKTPLDRGRLFLTAGFEPRSSALLAYRDHPIVSGLFEPDGFRSFENFILGRYSPWALPLPPPW